MAAYVLGERVRGIMDDKKIAYVPRGMLRRKFCAPDLPAYHVAERALTRQIMDYDAWRVCLIHTKSGMGKTTLLSQWYQELSDMPDCEALWVSLEPRDMHGASFARVLAALLQLIDGRFTGLSREFESVTDARSMLVDLVNLLDETCDPSKTYFLVMDDYDSASSEDMDAALVFLNKNLASNWRIIVAGTFLSSDLDDLLLDSSVMEFGTHDLAFDEERLRELSEKLLAWMDEASLAELERSAQGWPMAYVFFSLARKRATCEGDVNIIAGSYLARYFSKEIVSYVDDAVLDFMCASSLLDVMHPELCDLIAGTQDGHAILESLAARNLFTTKLGKDEYVFDPLFLEMLRNKLLESGHERIVHMAKLASAWYEKAGDALGEAKYRALCCEPTLIEDTALYSTAASYPDRYESLSEYLLKQPTSSYESDPYLIWVTIWAYIATGMVERARAMMALVNTACDEQTRTAYQYADALCLALEGRSLDSHEAVQQLLSLQGGDMPKEFRCLFLHMEGENCERMGRIRESRDLLMRALALAEQMVGSFYKLFDMYLLARHFLYCDDFDKAADYAERVLISADSEMPVWSAAHALIAYVHIERGELERAKAHLDLMDRGSLAKSNIDMHIDVTVAEARYAYVSGDRIGAISMMQDLVFDPMVSNVAVPRNVQYDAYSSLALMAAQVGDLVALQPCIEKLREGSAQPDLFRAIPCMISLAAYHWAAGEFDAAHELLEETRARIDASECPGAYWTAKTCILESAWLADEGKRSAGAAMLGRAISLAMRHGYMSIFLLGGSNVKTMLLELITNRKTPSAIKSFARRILTLFGDDAEIDEDLAMRKGDVQGYYSLTEREREILHLLNAGMSRQELSEHLVISQNTAKTHLKNIYAKLGVHTRAEAYRITREHEDF